ncbi:glycosyltransferase family 9 protein, partial [Streptomyces collinus]
MTPAPHLPRVLVLRALGLGDLLAGVPALRGVRRAFPGHRIHLALPPGLAEAARSTGAVDAVFAAEAPGRAVPSLTHRGLAVLRGRRRPRCPRRCGNRRRFTEHPSS